MAFVRISRSRRWMGRASQQGKQGMTTDGLTMPNHVEQYVRRLLLVVVLLLPAAELGREGAAVAGGGRGGRPIHRSLAPLRDWILLFEGSKGARPHTDSAYPCC